MQRYSNLLTWRFRLQLMIRRRLTQWAFVWIATLLICFGWWQVSLKALQFESDRVALMETRYSPVIQKQAEIQRIRRELDDLNSHQSLLVQLDDEPIPYHLLALVSMQVQQRDGAVRIESFKLTQPDGAVAASQASAGKPAAPNTAHSTMTLQGMAADNLAVSLFVAGLRDSGVFSAVDLKSSTGARVENTRAHNFTIECQL